MLYVPNILWARMQPEGYDPSGENHILAILERIGEVTVTCLVRIFSDFNIRGWSPWSWWLIASFSVMVLYELYWIRYFRSPRTMSDQYGPFFGIPIPGASLPVLAFILLAVYGCNPILAAATVVLGIGHLGIHIGHVRECASD
jgi:hypothetical protein